ncbi:hypothetical protein SELMODRAFT_417135 [Selaginella moellendorffii]|uniref:Uncharacterized protein n=1 Tax=Selaginella moellendorffii TaxID=88036 RepID=D8S1H1_SELML|nr:hypothetical protein SELMODRAFT_417135 [Selaginella moellendorffii]
MEVGDPDVFFGWGSKELDERKNYLATTDLFNSCLECHECLQAHGDETKMVVAHVRRAEARIYQARAIRRSTGRHRKVKGETLLGLKRYGSSSSCFRQVIEVKASPGLWAKFYFYAQASMLIWSCSCVVELDDRRLRRGIWAPQLPGDV